MTPVHIATKPYIKAWLTRSLPKLAISRNNPIGYYLLELLDKQTDNNAKKAPNYSERITLFIGNDTSRRQGGWLNATQTMQFNKFVGTLIRTQMRSHIITYMYFNPVLKKAIDWAREKEGLDCFELPDDTIIKDFQRYRDRHGGPRVYSKR